MNIFKAIGRFFTIPRKIRDEINANAVVQEIKPVLAPALAQSLAATVDAHVSDPAANLLIKAELGHLFAQSGLNQ